MALKNIELCLECGEDSLGFDGEFVKCSSCSYECLPEEHSKRYVENILNISEYAAVKHGDGFPVFNCPNCGIDAFVFYKDTFCFSCGNGYSGDGVGICETCSQPYIKTEDDLGICSNCYEYKMSKD